MIDVFRNKIKPYSDVILNFLFPCVCIKCETNIYNDILCDKCKSKINYISEYNICPKCGLELHAYENSCLFCKYNNKFKSIRTVVRYEDISRNIILDFKYSKVFECGDFIVSDIISHFPELYKRIEFDYITCVPTHFIKFAIRGYNHTQYISKKLSNELGIPFRKLVSRTRYVKSQTKIPHSRRAENIKNSFRLCVNENLENKNILLFEDVITSGNTIKEITAVLSAAKANVFVLAYADARYPKQLEDNIIHGYKL